MQVKPPVSYGFTPTRMNIIKKTSAGEDTEKLEPSYVAGRNVSGTASLENRQLLKMFNVQLPCDSEIPFLQVYTQET